MNNSPKRLPEINCDLGEGISGEELIFPLIDTASVACGGHFGTEQTIRATLELAKKFRKKAGAHPSYPDREHFGRKSIAISQAELERSLMAQIQTFLQVAGSFGIQMDHIKFHGALYNDAAKDAVLADFLTDFLLSNWPNVPVFVPPHSYMEEFAIKKGLPFRLEIFGDRAYLDTYQLAPRSMEGSLLTEKDKVEQHLKSIFFEKCIQSIEGTHLPIQADTLCFHGDNPGIHQFLPYLRKTYWT
jgi:UPF0271 protein